jgi:hypothetical protein
MGNVWCRILRANRGTPDGSACRRDRGEDPVDEDGAVHVVKMDVSQDRAIAVAGVICRNHMETKSSDMKTSKPAPAEDGAVTALLIRHQYSMRFPTVQAMFMGHVASPCLDVSAAVALHR